MLPGPSLQDRIGVGQQFLQNCIGPFGEELNASVWETYEYRHAFTCTGEFQDVEQLKPEVLLLVTDYHVTLFVEAQVVETTKLRTIGESKFIRR